MSRPEIQYLICQECGGAGFHEGTTCTSCDGRGMLAQLEGYILTGIEKITAEYVHERMIRNMLYRISVAISGALAVVGIGAALHTIYSYATPLITTSISLSEIFSDKDQSILLLFWIGMLAFLYAIYRVAEARHALQSVIQTPYRHARVLSWESMHTRTRSGTVDITTSCDDAIWRVLRSSFHIAKKFHLNSVSTTVIFSALLTQSPETRTMLLRLGIDFKRLVNALGGVLSSEVPGSAGLTVEAKRAFYQAYAEAVATRATNITIQGLLVVIARSNERLHELFAELGISERELEAVVQWFALQHRMKALYLRHRTARTIRSRSGLDRAMTAVATPYTNHFTHDITESARRGLIGMCIGRAEEFESIFRLAETHTTTGVILLGEPGVGVRALVEGLAERIVGGDVPAPFKEKRLVRLDLSALIAGVSASEAHERLLTILHEIIRAGNVVLCIEQVHELYGIAVGGSDQFGLIDVLTEAVTKGLLTLIATSTPRDYNTTIERTPLGNALTKLVVPELNEADAILVVAMKSGEFESVHGVTFSYQAIQSAVQLSARYMHEHRLPEKAIRLLEQVAVYAKQHPSASGLVAAEQVAEVVSQTMHVPVSTATVTEATTLLHLEKSLHQRVIGQDEAVQSVASALRRARAELRDQKRPIASFLFLGPTGVGKTELAKAVAAIYFGSEESMVRLDMSEFQDASSVHRLIGAPAGYTGDSRGQLTEAVRQRPYSIVLLDELEKAHPDILNLFLQVLDDGRLSDSTGMVVDFTNTIIIATSNAGAQYIQDTIAAGSIDMQRIKQNLMEHELRTYYRPEFLNRFDGVIVFTPLSVNELEAITRLLLARISETLALKHIKFRATDEAVAELARLGYDPAFGARPLRRAIQERVDNALADLLLRQHVSRRDEIILEVGGQLRIERAPKL